MSDGTSFDQFWLHYLREHALPGTRALHFFGTTAAFLSLAAALFIHRPGLALAGIAFGYGCAWAGHFLVEGNRPTMVSRPLWSFACDVRMTWLWYAGRLSEQLARAGVREAEAAEATS